MNIPHMKIMRVNNFELFIQQVQIMIIVQLKQGFSLRKSRICTERVIDCVKDHYRETAIPFLEKGRGFDSRVL